MDVRGVNADVDVCKVMSANVGVCVGVFVGVVVCYMSESGCVCG